jgi:biopolymer transport protein ExbD/biopolymer transport protein TolR
MSTRRQWQPRGARVVEPDMNVTPLVDVVLVLLIIFMVVAPRMEQDIPVTLPGIFHPDPDTEVSSPPLILTVKRAGEYVVAGQRHDLDSAIMALSAAHARDPSRRLELRADATLRYKDVRAIYGRARQVGFPGMSLLVSHRYRAGQPVADEAVPAAAGLEQGPEGRQE